MKSKKKVATRSHKAKPKPAPAAPRDERQLAAALEGAAALEEIDTAAFERHAEMVTEAAAAEPVADAHAADALSSLIDQALGEPMRPEPSAPAADAPLGIDPTPIPDAPAPRRGGWPKGRPRGPRATSAAATTAHAPMTGEVSGDPVRRLRSVERETEALRKENADLKARVDTNTHGVIKKGIGAMIVMMSNIGARKYGQHMRVPMEEANECGEHVGNALIPFLGDYSRYMPIVVAVSAVASLAIPRMQVEQEIREGKRPRLMVDGSVGPVAVE